MTETAAISESYLPSRTERAARLVQLWFVGIVAGLRFILLAMLSAVFVTFLVGLRVLGEADFGITDSPGWVFEGFGVVLAIAAVIGSLIAMRRLPRRRRSYAAAAIARSGDDATTAEEREYLDGICSALGIAAGITSPVVRVIDSPACNAMAVSQARGEATLVLTRGLLATGRRPVEAIIAYEMTLMARGEVSLVTWVLALTGAEGTKGDVANDSVTSAAGTGRVGRWLRSWALAGFARRRDVAALSMTRDPQSLAAALRAVADDTGVPATLCADDAPLWLEYPGQDPAEFSNRIAALERGAVDKQ
ncbi:MAG: hypothetical protein U0W40_13610 [Acidimicrobiia bacterium]